MLRIKTGLVCVGLEGERNDLGREFHEKAKRAFRDIGIEIVNPDSTFFRRLFCIPVFYQLYAKPKPHAFYTSKKIVLLLKLQKPGVREICDEFGIVMIADEIAIGMGRTGKWWCIENYDVVPDMIVFILIILPPQNLLSASLRQRSRTSRTISISLSVITYGGINVIRLP